MSKEVRAGVLQAYIHELNTAVEELSTITTGVALTCVERVLKRLLAEQHKLENRPPDPVQVGSLKISAGMFQGSPPTLLFELIDDEPNRTVGTKDLILIRDLRDLCHWFVNRGRGSK